GRHLLPTKASGLEPLRLSKTFHWPRQLRQVEALKTRFSVDTLAHVCPGASTGFLRGQRTVDRAYDRLQQLDLDAYRDIQPLL
ncbi:MAG: MBL fold metallo-hydrolase, partial [Cyanobacteria bacterium J06638_6]